MGIILLLWRWRIWVAIGAAVISFGGLYLSNSYNSNKAAKLTVITNQQKTNLKVSDKANEVGTDINRTSSDDVRKRLLRWCSDC